MRNVRFHPSAREELLEALRWYAERSEPAAAFRQEVDHSIQRISQSPEQFPKTRGDARRFVMLRFPFSIVYSLTETEIVIVAIAHQRRRPGYWLVPRRI